MYYVIRNGNIEPGAFTQGAGSYNVRDGDEVVFYIGALDNNTWTAKTFIPQVEITPAAPKAGENFNIKIKAVKYDWSSGLVDLTPQELRKIGEFTVTVGDKEYQTQNGQVVIPAINAGTLSFTVRNTNEAGYPDVVTYKGSIEIGASGGSGSTIQKISVQLAIVGRNRELIFGPSTVTIAKESPYGYTPLGALDASGVDYTVSEKYSGFVESIAGQANEGMSGWMFTVNDTVSSVGADQYTLQEDDKVIWYYSKDTNEQPPKWDDLVKQAASGTVSAATAAQQVADLISGLQSGKLTPAKALADISGLLDQVKTTEVTDELKGKLADAVQALSQLLANIPDKAVSIQADGEMRLIKIDAQAVKDQVSSIKNAAALAERLDQLGVTGTANLVTKQIAVNLPSEPASQKGFAIKLPAEAVQEIVSANLALVVNGLEASLSLPMEVLKGALEITPDLSGLELSVARVDTAKLNPFKGASVIGNRAYDFEVNATTPEGKKEALKGGFAKKVMVTLSLEGIDLEGIDRNRVAVYRQNQGGSWEFVGGSLSEDGKTYSFETDHLSLYALMEFQNPFQDVTNHWAREAIEEMAMRLIIRGVSADTFAPDQPLTRSQLAALLVKALDLEQQTPSQATFRDVAAGYWGYGVIEAAAKAGLIKGTGSGNFEPDRPVKREEMATVLANILKHNGLDAGLTAVEVDALLQGYKDSGEISPWAKDGMAICINKGIVGGRPSATLAPKDQASRAEAAVVLLKLLKLLGRL